MKKRLVLLVILALFTHPALVHAESSNIKLRILPQDCLFEVIDSGTQQLRFLTPELCGEVLPLPPETPPEPGRNITIQNNNNGNNYFSPETGQSSSDQIKVNRPLALEKRRITINVPGINVNIQISFVAILLLAALLIILLLSRRRK